MGEIDYTNCTKEDLADILNHIDREKYPERTALVQSLYDSKEDLNEHEQGEVNEITFMKIRNLISGALLLIFAPVVLIFGVNSNRLFYSINIESLQARIVAFLVMVAMGIYVLVQWYKNKNSQVTMVPSQVIKHNFHPI